MAKSRKMWVCSNCGHEATSWVGKCPNCGEWNTFKQFSIPEPDAPHQKHSISSTANKSAEPNTISSILERIANSTEKRNYQFSADALNTFWGNGLTAGSLTLLAGEPGLGKSTLALQLLRALYTSDDTLKLLYITAEESEYELARRSQRLGIPQSLLLVQANNFDQIEQAMTNNPPNVVIIDSIQTIFAPDITSSPGSVTQVSTLASRFLAISKSYNIAIIMVGHVTKDGQIAGPKTLEHLVDSVLLLDASDNAQYRTLSFSKHRFGNTTGLLLMKMEENGLQIVTDPSLALLENLESGVGVVYALGMSKDLPLAVEIQALVSTTKGEDVKKSFGQRQALGIKQAKLNTIIAIAEKYLSISLTSVDIFIQVTGMPKNTTDESLDLPILLAILSSLFNQPINNFLKTKKDVQKLAFAGRLTLSGTIRAPTNETERKNTAKKLGFTYNYGIELGQIKKLING